MTIQQHARWRTDPGRDAFCEWCGHLGPESSQRPITVPDSSYLHPTDPTHDWPHHTHACSPDHARQLTDYGTHTWLDAQLSYGK